MFSISRFKSTVLINFDGRRSPDVVDIAGMTGNRRIYLSNLKARFPGGDITLKWTQTRHQGRRRRRVRRQRPQWKRWELEYDPPASIPPSLRSIVHPGCCRSRSSPRIIHSRHRGPVMVLTFCRNPRFHLTKELGMSSCFSLLSTGVGAGQY